MRDESLFCRYCNGFLHKDGPYRTALCNTILLESHNFVVVPTVGMIIPGWLLLITKQHIPNMASIPHSWHDEINDLLSRSKAMVSARFAPPFVFEHGAVPQQCQASGSCVNHAHLHLIPSFHIGEIEKDIFSVCNFSPILGLSSLPKALPAESGYLYYESTVGHAYAGLAEDVPSQLIRRIVAAHSQKSDQWNWVLFPENANIQLTIDAIQTGDIT